ncbi:Holliday junction resolvase RuvX [Candidatus Collinsella stercoripullorum]|uniref:Holliday junction resolvase RuvX n=1 Tax=Candidatus Collinsella stercoripullorum TaxID=2838522 RepID=UPI0022E4720F|nr:Holliday junction resolvase RuvX [Candidatus Collinsella stercoripullorum]
MVALALDIGDARIGVAVSDRTGTVASPVKVLPAAEVLGLSRSFRAIVADHEPDVLVVGRPRTLAGEDGPQAERVMEAGRDLARALGLPVEFADERLSSAEAKRILREQGLTERKMRGKVDMLAASLFLQAWLDSRNGGDVRGQA